MKKIYLSPSDQVKNTYAAGNTNEAAQCRAMALALADALERKFEASHGKFNKDDSLETQIKRANAMRDWIAQMATR